MAEPGDVDLTAHAHDLLDRIAYLTLGTVGPDGRPWCSPVYFAADGLHSFYWTSSRESRHSVHLAARPEVSLVVFDSTVPPYHGSAVYASAVAREVGGEEVAAGLAVYPGPVARGGSALTEDDVTGESPWRLFRADADRIWVLCPRAPRQPCRLHGRADDHRALVDTGTSVSSVASGRQATRKRT